MNLAAAIRERDPSQLPGKRDEEWRWTDLRGLLREIPAASEPPTRFRGLDRYDVLDFDEAVDIANGGEFAFSVPEGERWAIRLRVLAQNAGAHTTEVTVQVGKGGGLVFIESYESDPGSLCHTSLTFDLGEGARAERLVLCDDDAEAVSVSQAKVSLGADSDFAQLVLTTGARRQRIETRLVHPGQGAKVRLDSAYLLRGKAHADLTTEVIHEGAGGETDQVTRGVVTDQARGVFQGRIVVARGADGTDARMRHDALILSDRAEVDAKPELEIYADDVSCAHGNTVGALDEDALFYARQRGIPDEEARELLTGAFVGAVAERLASPDLQDLANRWIGDRLRRA